MNNSFFQNQGREVLLMWLNASKINGPFQGKTSFVTMETFSWFFWFEGKQRYFLSYSYQGIRIYIFMSICFCFQMSSHLSKCSSELKQNGTLVHKSFPSPVFMACHVVCFILFWVLAAENYFFYWLEFLNSKSEAKIAIFFEANTCKKEKISGQRLVIDHIMRKGWKTSENGFWFLVPNF